MSERAQFGLFIFGIFFGALGVSVAVGMLFARFLALIQLKHPDVWEMLGRPVIFPATLQDTARLGMFIAKREYRSVNDLQLKRIGDGLLAIGVVFVIFAIVLDMFANN